MAKLLSRKYHILKHACQFSKVSTPRFQQMHSFPAIDCHFDCMSNEALKNRDKNLQLSHDALELREKIIKKGQAVPKRDKGPNKLSTYDRMSLLMDPDCKPLILSVNAGEGLPYGSTNSAGVLVAVVKVMGQYCVINANDWSSKGGTLYPISLKKQLRAQEISKTNRLPCVYIVDSGGAFLPLQADIFPDKYHGGRVFRNEAVMSAIGIPQIAVVCGPCTAGGAYVPMMCDEAVIVKGIGSLYLGGPPLVKAAMGEIIGAEELGGADVHCRISGCTDHYASSEEEAMEITRHIVASLNLKTKKNCSRQQTVAPLYESSMEDMASLIPTVEEDRWPIMEILARLIDRSGFLPFKDKYGQNLICGFSRMNGYLVGVLANNGELNAPAAVKGAHFIRQCDVRGIPMLFLQHTPSDKEFISPAGNSGTVAKARSQMITTLATSKVPKITILMGGAYGPSSFAMCGRSMSPNFIFSWPQARVGIASQRHISQSDTSNSEDTITASNSEQLNQEQSYSSHLYDDGVILPHETREVVSQCLEICSHYESDVSNSSVVSPVFRM